jgi:anti-anti-sigma regulatory factor
LPNVIAVDRLRPGDHACLSFSSDEERWEVLRVFAHHGFARGEKVVFFVDRATPADEVTRRVDAGKARRAGQFVVFSTTAWYEPSRFNRERCITQTRRAIDAACEEGYSGLRGTGDMAWALRPGIKLSELLSYERAADRTLFRDWRYTGLCQYDRRRFDEQMIHTIDGIHPVALLDRVGALHVTLTATGLRLAGDCDLTTRAELVTALQHARKQAASVLRLDLTELSFLDARCCGEILQLAAAMHGVERLEISCRPQLRRVLTLLGAASLASLTFRGDELR